MSIYESLTVSTPLWARHIHSAVTLCYEVCYDQEQGCVAELSKHLRKAFNFIRDFGKHDHVYDHVKAITEDFERQLSNIHTPQDLCLVCNKIIDYVEADELRGVLDPVYHVWLYYGLRERYVNPSATLLIRTVYTQKALIMLRAHARTPQALQDLRAIAQGVHEPGPVANAVQHVRDYQVFIRQHRNRKLRKDRFADGLDQYERDLVKHSSLMQESTLLTKTDEIIKFVTKQFNKEAITSGARIGKKP